MTAIPTGLASAGHNAPMPYLEVKNLWKAFGDFLALKDVSLSVAKGEFICFLGPSGCGKTTLLRAIAGLDPQSRGTIHQGGRDISSLPASRRDYGIVFQSYALFPNLTVDKNIAFGLENTGRSKPEITARVAELLALVGLPGTLGYCAEDLLYHGALEAEPFLGFTLLLATALNAIHLFRLFSKLFLGQSAANLPEVPDALPRERWPLALCTVFLIAGGIVPSVIVALRSPAAEIIATALGLNHGH